ncbi:restriction endonuclease subunit S [Mycobacteroides saopaulense]|nr:restriction endonuclease subunit S [Mycobacteroides saopaulense]
MIRDLAVRGLLSERDDTDEPVDELLESLGEKREVLVTRKKVRRCIQPRQNTTTEPPFILPDTWRWVRLSELLADMHYGLTAKASTKVAEPAFVRITDIKNGQIQWQSVPGCADGEGGLDKFRLTAGDVLVARSGSVGVSSVVGELPRAAVFASYLIRLIPLEQWFSKWWPVFAGSGFYWSQVRNITTGSAQPNINSTNMRDWLVPVPPLQEQHRIVGRVEELMELCDELEAWQAARTEARTVLTSATLCQLSHADRGSELREVLSTFTDNIAIHLAPGTGDFATVKQLRQSIIDLAVRGHLTRHDESEEPAAELLKRISDERDRMVKAKEIRKPRVQARISADRNECGLPLGWERASMGQLVLSSDSGWSPACLPSRRDDDAKWGVLKVSAVSWGDFRAAEHKQLTPGLIPRPQIEVQDGDFLMSRANTAQLVGRSVVVTDPPPRLMLSDKHIRLRFLDRMTAEYVNLVNGSSAAREYYAAVATGTSDSMRNITREQILALPISVPPLIEQKRIIKVVRALHAHCDKLEVQLHCAQMGRMDLSASIAARVVGGNS